MAFGRFMNQLNRLDVLLSEHFVAVHVHEKLNEANHSHHDSSKAVQLSYWYWGTL